MFAHEKPIMVAAAVRRNCARVMPCRFAPSVVSSMMSFASVRALSVIGSGHHSPFDTGATGNGSSASS